MTTTPLDVALRDLRALALQHGWERVRVLVRSDGRVAIEASSFSGFEVERVLADLDPDGVHPLPSVVIAKLRRDAAPR